MNINVAKYNLPDISILYSKNSFDFHLWIPDNNYLIIGRSNNAKKSLYTNAVLNDNVAVYKRPSGGESVILTPNTIVLSIKKEIEDNISPNKYFKIFNDLIMDILSGLGIKNLDMRGISDISIGNKKILGSSIYKSKSTLFYHAVLNVCESLDMIDKYLKHPTREPDYRKGRSHKEFVTSIFNEGYLLSFDEIQNAIRSGLLNYSKQSEFCTSMEQI